MTERTITLSTDFEPNALALLVQTASQFASHVSLVRDEKTANAKSIMGIIALELQGGQIIKIETNGTDEQAAAAAVEQHLLGLGTAQ